MKLVDMLLLELQIYHSIANGRLYGDGNRAPVLLELSWDWPSARRKASLPIARLDKPIIFSHEQLRRSNLQQNTD